MTVKEAGTTGAHIKPNHERVQEMGATMALNEKDTLINPSAWGLPYSVC